MPVVGCTPHTENEGGAMTRTPTTDISQETRRVARDAFGWEDLHDAQVEAIEAVVSGRDTLVVLPTGYGKSAIYQVAGALLDGPVVVVSPLISLQADQVAGLVGRPDAPPAAAVNSGRSNAENEAAWNAWDRGDITYFFLSPEQLAVDAAIDRLSRARVGLFVVDEAHSVSSWGHDFRPDYLHLGEYVERLGRPPVLALTATGSGPVRDEIVERLHLDEPLVLVRGFDRPNLALAVERHEEASEKREAVLADVRASAGPGILYVATRREADAYASELSEGGATVASYHAGLGSGERGRIHERFHLGDIDVVVATSAFGMGIDKPDVRFVVHADIPDSLESYYQEIGRAGRDGEPSEVTLHYREEDLGLRTFFASGLPSLGELARLFAVLADAARFVSRSRLAAASGLAVRRSGRLLDLLVESGSVTENRRGVRARKGIEPRDASRRARDIAESRERVEKSRIDMMRGYAETQGCRRHFLLAYFGEESPERCGTCDTCVSGAADETLARVADPSTPVSPAPFADPFPPETAVVHPTWGDGTVVSVEDDRLTVFFDREGYKVLSRGAIADGDLLAVRDPS